MSDYRTIIPKLNPKKTGTYQNFRNSLESKLSQVTLKNNKFLDTNLMQKKFFSTQPQISSQFQLLSRNIERMNRQRFSPVSNSQTKYSSKFKFYNSPRKKSTPQQQLSNEKQQIDEKQQKPQLNDQQKEENQEEEKIKRINSESQQTDSYQNAEEFQRERFENFKKVLEHCWKLEKQIRTINSDQNILLKQNELMQLEKSKNQSTIEHLTKEKHQMVQSINKMQIEYENLSQQFKIIEDNLNQSQIKNRDLLQEKQQLIRITNLEQRSQSNDQTFCDQLFQKYIENRKIQQTNQNSLLANEFNQENSLQKQVKNLQNTIQFIIKQQKLNQQNKQLFQTIQENLQNVKIQSDSSFYNSQLSLEEQSFVEGKYCLQQAIESLDDLNKKQSNLKYQNSKEILQNLRVTQQYFQKHEILQQKKNKSESLNDKKNPLQLELNNKFRQFFDNNDLQYEDYNLSKDINQQNIQFLEFMISAIDTGGEEERQSFRKNTANSLSLKHNRLTPQNFNRNKSNNQVQAIDQRTTNHGQNIQETISISNEEKTLRITEDDYFKMKVLLEDKKKSINQQKKIQQEQQNQIIALEDKLKIEKQNKNEIQKSLNSHQQQINKYKQQLAELQNYCEDIQNKIESQQNLTKEIEKLRNQNQKLQDDLNNSQTVVDRDSMMKQEFIKLQQHYRSLQNQLKNSQEKNQKKLNKLEEENKTLVNNNNTFQRQIEQLKSELEIKSLENHNLQHQLQNIQKNNYHQQNRIDSGSLSDNMQNLEPHSNNDLVAKSYQILKSSRSNNKSFYSLQQQPNDNLANNFFNEENSQMHENLKRYLDIELLRIKNQLIKDHDKKVQRLNKEISQLQKELKNKESQQLNLRNVLEKIQSDKQQIVKSYDEKIQENENLKIQFQKLKIKNYQIEQIKLQNTEQQAKIQKLEKEIEILKQKDETEEDEENDSEIYSEDDDDDSIFKDQQVEVLKNKSEEIVERPEPAINFDEKIKQINKQNEIFTQLIKNTKELISKSIKQSDKQATKDAKIDQIIRLEEYEKINDDQKKELETINKGIMQKEEKKQQKIETIKKINQMFNNLVNERNKIFEELAQQKKRKYEILQKRDQNLSDQKIQEGVTQELQKIEQEAQTQDSCLKEYEEEIQQLKEYWNQNLKQNQILDQEISKLQNKKAKLIRNYDYDLQVLIDQVKNIHKEQQKSTKNNQQQIKSI